MIKCHGQLAGTGGGHQLNHPRPLCVICVPGKQSSDNVQEFRKKAWRY